jgi:hypothetical protein
MLLHCIAYSFCGSGNRDRAHRLLVWYPVNWRGMLTEKQFSDRAMRELREIGMQVQGLCSDRDLFRRFESQVVASNPRLSENGDRFLATIRAAYTDATTMRLRRLYAPDANLSLRRVVAQFSEYPGLLHNKLTGKELTSDLAELDRTAAYLKEHIDPHFTSRERTPAALTSPNRELDRALDLLIDCIKRYYWIVADAHIDLDPSSETDPLAVFRFPWLE